MSPLPSSSITSSSSPLEKEPSSIILSPKDEPPKHVQSSNYSTSTSPFLQLYLNKPAAFLLSNNKEFVCGWGSAFINIFITFPINKLIFRQQLYGISGLKAVRQLRKDGMRYLYRGLLPPLLQKTTSISIMFGMYTKSRKVLEDVLPSLSSRSNIVLSALIAGTLEASLTPFERVQTLMQNQKYHNRFSNTFEAFRTVWRHGPTEYYRGLSVVIIRNGPSNCCFFLGREYLNATDPDLTPGEKIAKDFLGGACLGALISTFFFPFNVVKTHMQAQLGGPFVNIWTTFRSVLAERNGNIRHLFKGIHLNYTRSLISWGIINASYEILMDYCTHKCDRKL